MLIEINKELYKLKGQIDFKEKYIDIRDSIKKDCSAKSKELARYKNTLLEEQKDVDQLQELSIVGILYSLIGRKEVKLFDEKRELLDAKMNLERILAEQQVLLDELDSYKKKVSHVISLEARYAELEEQKKATVKGLSGELLTSIEGFEDAISIGEKKLVEIEEAISVGNSTYDSLRRAQHFLSKARGWATYDIHSDSGFIVSNIKNGHIKDASNQIAQSQYFMKRFSKELEDVSIEKGDIKRGIGTITFQYDRFFDSSFADRRIRKAIDSATTKVNGYVSSVNSMLSKLRLLRNDTEDNIYNANKQLDDLINQY